MRKLIPILRRSAVQKLFYDEACQRCNFVLQVNATRRDLIEIIDWTSEEVRLCPKEDAPTAHLPGNFSHSHDMDILPSRHRCRPRREFSGITILVFATLSFCKKTSLVFVFIRAKYCKTIPNYQGSRSLGKGRQSHMGCTSGEGGRSTGSSPWPAWTDS